MQTGGLKSSNIVLPGGCCVNSIAVDPKNSSGVYAVGQGAIYKSTDGGGKWVLKNKGLTASPETA